MVMSEKSLDNYCQRVRSSYIISSPGSSVENVLRADSCLEKGIVTYSCANQAAVTTPRRSLNSPMPLAVGEITTTAFCTVLLVTSADLRFNFSALICRVQAIPNRLVAVGDRSRFCLGVVACFGCSVSVVGSGPPSCASSAAEGTGGAGASPLSRRAK